MRYINKKIHYRAIAGSLAIMLHVPAIMFLLSCLVAFIFGEYFALVPFAMSGILLLACAQILYRRFPNVLELRLWDSMVIAALTWLLCPIISAIPFHFTLYNYAALTDPFLFTYAGYSNALFECFSGFTSTGLTLLDKPNFFPHVLLWFRSLMQWIGGIGLIVFMVSIVDFHRKAYNLYYSEGRSDKIGVTVKETARLIWVIYFSLTVLATLIFWVLEMSFWEALNHAMCAISTGGFVITNAGIGGYATTTQISIVFFIILGAMSFSMYYYCITNKVVHAIWIDKEHRFFLIYAFLGAAVLILINWLSHGTSTYFTSFFNWISGIGTCGYSIGSIKKMTASSQLFLIMGMLIGGCIGSTAGGLKVHRILHVFSGMAIRIRSVFTYEQSKLIEEYGIEKKQGEGPSGVKMSGEENIKRLYVANILFSLWTLCVIIAWVLLLIILEDEKPLSVLFNVVSAMSNVGLSTGVVFVNIPLVAKYIFIALMWIGRLEIVPATILFLAFFIRYKPSEKR